MSKKKVVYEIPCRARYHMSMAEYALYDLAMSWTDGGTKLLFFDGPKMAAQFREGSKQHFYKLESALVSMGWFVLTVDKSRRANGHWSSRAYRVLTHDQWASCNPNGCPKLNENGVVKNVKAPVNLRGTVKTYAVQKSQTPVTTQPVNCDNPASQPGQPSQSTIEAKACKTQHVVEHVENKPVRPAGKFSKFPHVPFPEFHRGGTQTESEAACIVPPVNHGGTAGKKPVNPGGTDDRPVNYQGTEGIKGVTIEWDSERQRYVNAKGRQLDYEEINELISPNKYEGGKFWNENGMPITLEMAQGKELVTA